MSNDLFSEEELKEEEICFPIYVKNNNETRFTWYKNETQFEEITINRYEDNFRGSLMFGFNEQLIGFKDVKLWLDAVLRNHTVIEQSEYDETFSRLINGRLEFFDDSIESKYVDRELSEQQKSVKHKWKAPEY